MMNKEQLIEYKASLEADLKRTQSGLERIKLEILSKKRMLKLIEEQIKELEPVNQMSKVVDEMSQL